MVRENLNINLDKYIHQVEKEFPSLSSFEAKEVVKELYNFLEEFYFLEIDNSQLIHNKKNKL